MNPALRILKLVLIWIAVLAVAVLCWFYLTWGMFFSYKIGEAVKSQDGPSERMTEIAISATDTGIIDINGRDMDYTPLQWALMNIEISRSDKLHEAADPAKQERIVATLLQHGADPCKIYSYGTTTIQKFQDDVALHWSTVPKPQAERLIAMMQAATGGNCPVGGRK